jgi:hypothetical protein
MHRDVRFLRDPSRLDGLTHELTAIPANFFRNADLINAEKQKGAFRAPFYIVVGRAGFEPATN